MAEVDTIDIPDVTPVTRTVATMSKLIKTQGLPTDAAAAQTDTTSVTQTSILKQLSAYLLILSGAVGSSKVATKAAAADFADGSIATLGLKADAKSTATDTTAITLMSVAKQISASVQSLVTALGSITNTTNALDINVKSGGTPVGTGADSTGALVTFTTEGKASVGALTETAPATDTASSGLNGRLQRIAQRITSLIGLLPTALGGSGGLKVDDIFSQYETVAASATAQALGATGATGDYLAGVLVFPATAGCGVVTILDNGVTIGTFPGGGTTALPSLVPFMIPVGLYSVSGAWKITTGANVAAVGVGKFT